LTVDVDGFGVHQGIGLCRRARRRCKKPAVLRFPVDGREGKPVGSGTAPNKNRPTARPAHFQQAGPASLDCRASMFQFVGPRDDGSRMLRSLMNGLGPVRPSSKPLHNARQLALNRLDIGRYVSGRISAPRGHLAPLSSARFFSRQPAGRGLWLNGTMGRRRFGGERFATTIPFHFRTGKAVSRFRSSCPTGLHGLRFGIHPRPPPPLSGWDTAEELERRPGQQGKPPEDSVSQWERCPQLVGGRRPECLLPNRL